MLWKHSKRLPKSENKRRLRFGFRPKRKAPMALSLKKDLFNLPNSITMLRIILIPAVLVFLSFRTPGFCVLAVLFFGIAAISDFFDGYLARRLNLVSVTGKFLDPLADKLMVMATTVQLASMGWLESWIPIVILTRELAVQGLRLIAVGEGMVIAAGSGGKIKTALQLVGLVGLLAHYTYPFSLFGYESTLNLHQVGWWLMVMSIFFSLVSAWQYFMGFLKALENKDNS